MMPDSTQDRPEKVSLEELLHFKRSEQPAPEFWDGFDRELHQRMLKALVKKDPWPVQVMRGLSSRMAQTAAIVGLAAFLALAVLQPAFFVTNTGPLQTPLQTEVAGGLQELSQTPVQAAALAQPAEPAVPAVPAVPAELVSPKIEPNLLAEADYGIERISLAMVDEHAGVRPEYGLDHIEVTSYDRAAYSADMPLPGFASTGVASLVY